MIKTKGLSRSSVLALSCLLLLIICCSLWWILQVFKYASLILLVAAFSVSFFPFSNLFPISCIGAMDLAVNLVKLLNILITVSSDNALADILKKARKQQLKNRMQYGELYHRNFYKEIIEKNRVHYEYYNLGMTEDVPELEGFHFHTIRHTYTTNLLSNGAQPKDVQ